MSSKLLKNGNVLAFEMAESINVLQQTSLWIADDRVVAMIEDIFTLNLGNSP